MNILNHKRTHPDSICDCCEPTENVLFEARGKNYAKHKQGKSNLMMVKRLLIYCDSAAALDHKSHSSWHR